MKTGELTHTGTAVTDNEHFEPKDADTFEGLGLPKSLADHLEGKMHSPEGPCLYANDVLQSNHSARIRCAIALLT